MVEQFLPCDDILKILIVYEKYFRGEGWKKHQCIQKPTRGWLLVRFSVSFSSLVQHDIVTHTKREDFHSTQIMKGVLASYLMIMLLRHAQQYTKIVVKKGLLGKRQEMTKLMLFNGLQEVIVFELILNALLNEFGEFYAELVIEK